MSAPSRKELLAARFIVAGDRGLTGPQMHSIVGRNWRRWLDELVADGYVFREDRSRFPPRAVFRWVLRAEPVAAGETCELPAVTPLFDPPAPLAASPYVVEGRAA